MKKGCLNMLIAALFAITLTSFAVPAFAAKTRYLPQKATRIYADGGSKTKKEWKYNKNGDVVSSPFVSSYTYSGNKLTKAVIGASALKYKYDSKGRIKEDYYYYIKESGALSEAIGYSKFRYDKNGKLKSRTIYELPDNGKKFVKAGVIKYKYQSGKLKKAERTDLKGKPVVTVAYNKKGYPASIIHRWDSESFVQTFKYTYGKHNTVKTVKVYADGKLDYTLKYGAYKTVKGKKRPAVIPVEVDHIVPNEELISIRMIDF